MNISDIATVKVGDRVNVTLAQKKLGQPHTVIFGAKVLAISDTVWTVEDDHQNPRIRGQKYSWLEVETYETVEKIPQRLTVDSLRISPVLDIVRRVEQCECDELCCTCYSGVFVIDGRVGYGYFTRVEDPNGVEGLHIEFMGLKGFYTNWTKIEFAISEYLGKSNVLNFRLGLV